MNQSLFAGKEFNKSTEWHNRLHSRFVNISDDRYGNDYLSPCFRALYSFFIGTEYTHLAHVIYFFDIDRSTGLALHFLDHFTTRPDNSTDKFAVDEHLDHPGCMRFYLGPGFRHAL